MTLFDVMPDAEKARIGLWTPQKAETGPGAFQMMYDNKLSVFGKADPHAQIKAAQLLYHANPWVNAAERAVTNQFSNVDWHLEDENDEEIDDNATPEQRLAMDLLERPQANLARGESQGLTRRSLWSLTSRHMGLCGTTFWFGNGMSLDHIPTAFLYINPSRMTPVMNPNGYLMGYKLDQLPHDPNSGYPLDLEEVMTFHLDPGDTEGWGIGLAEASGILGDLWMEAAKHQSSVLNSGGRLAGIMMPKPGVEMSDDAWKALKRDMRTISEDPQAAKRNLIIKKPMDFLPSAINPRDLDLMSAKQGSRDDILAFWGVPKTQVPIEVAAGLNNGGATKDRDTAVLWKGAVHSRLVAFAEVIQYQLLDHWKARGVTLELEIEEPDFTEDAPKYQNAASAISQPLRNRERRAILGLDPFGDPALDEAVWLPLTMTSAYVTPDAQGTMPMAPAAPMMETPEEGDGIEAKAAVGKRPLMGLRRQVQATWEPSLRTAVGKVLAEQRAEIVAKVKRNAAHIAKKPTDTASWWDEPRWGRALSKVLTSHTAAVAEDVTGHVATILEPKVGKAAPVWAEPIYARLLKKVGLRVTGLLETTRDAVLSIISATIRKGIDEGLGAAQLGNALEVALNNASTFDEYRAEMIARTETMNVYNSAALDSYREFGMEQVQAIDGDGDPECAARDGQVFSLDEAAAETEAEHPNGTLDWTPYFPEDVPAKAKRLLLERDAAGRVIAISEATA
jgi:SPP1 gp7 family putative phage head morphogenesis protein